MRNWLIANAKAGNGGRNTSFWLERLEAVGLTELEIRDVADTAWEQEIQEGDLLLVAGGDGTVSRAAALCVERGTILAVLPSGTANDFARNLGLPNDPMALCEMVATGRVMDIDVAWINDRLFLNVAHIGLGTLPSREASSEHKSRFGRFSYLAVLAGKLGANRGLRARIDHDGGRIYGRWLSIAIASGAFFGGGQRVPEATINDGNLDVVAIRPRPFFRLLFAWLITRLSGHTPRWDSTVVHIKTKRCKMLFRHARTLTADGEVIGRVTEIDAGCRPGVLKVICEKVVGT